MIDLCQTTISAAQTLQRSVGLIFPCDLRSLLKKNALELKNLDFNDLAGNAVEFLSEISRNSNCLA